MSQQGSINILYGRIRLEVTSVSIRSSRVGLHGSAVSLQGSRRASKAAGDHPRLQVSLNNSRKAFSTSGYDSKTTLKHPQLQAEPPKLRTEAPRLHGEHSRLQDVPIIQGENSRF
jgi:hypothetical protein